MILFGSVDAILAYTITVRAQYRTEDGRRNEAKARITTPSSSYLLSSLLVLREHSHYFHCYTIPTTMFATKFSVGSFRHSARSPAWRAFSNTAATFADQYDVVVVGTFFDCDCILGLCCLLFLIFFSLDQQAVDRVAMWLPSNRHKWA